MIGILESGSLPEVLSTRILLYTVEFLSTVAGLYMKANCCILPIKDGLLRPPSRIAEHHGFEIAVYKTHVKAAALRWNSTWPL